jgi:uncharacterized membrane protein YkvA (DUF1232 family)
MAQESFSGSKKTQRPSSLWATITSYARLLFHRDTPWTVKGILGLAIIYLLSPFDLVPEWLGALGLIDDLAIVSLLVGWAIRLAERRNQGGTTKTK